MVDGEGGIPGLNVPRPVAEERLRGQENVIWLEISVGVLLLKPEIIVTKVNVSLLQGEGFII